MNHTPLEALEACISAGMFINIFQAPYGSRSGPGQVVLTMTERSEEMKEALGKLKSDDLVNLAPHYVKKYL